MGIERYEETGSPMTDEDEYRFYPEDFDNNGELIDDRDEFDPAALIIVGSLGAGTALILLDPVVEPVRAVGTELELRTLSSLVFALGLFTGSGVYVRQGKRSLASVHVLGAFGWLSLAIGSILGNEALLFVGALALVVGVTALVVMVWQSSS